MTQWEKNQRFGARVAHRIRMTEKINREAKERHAAEMAAYEARIGAFKFELYPSRNEPKKTINEKLDFFSLNEGKLIFLVRKLNSFL